MSRAIVFATTILSLFALNAAQAAVQTGFEEARRPSSSSGVQLAQYRGDVEVYIDGQGREILVDSYTREVLGVRDSRTEARQRRAPRDEFGGGPYRLEDPADMERFRRDREILLGRREPPPGRSADDYRNGADDIYQDDHGPDDRAGYPRDDGQRHAYPPAPGRRDIAREPLSAPPDVAAVPPASDGNGEPPADVLIETPPRTASVPETTGTVPPSDTAPIKPDVLAVERADTREDVAKIQILLDRKNISPGVIDGRMGDNVNKAISAYRDMTGQTLRTYDKEFIDKALEESGGPAFIDYTIQPEDAAGPYVASVPEDYGQKAKLDRLGYTSVEEMLGERFHMDVNYLKVLNPGANFARPGTIIRVANTGRNAEGKVSRIIADKPSKQVRAYGADGKLVAVYPATIGSAATPSPSGTHTVERIAFDPEYTYNPKINFKQGDNDRILKIPPGPNGPVGTIWIALSKPTYGIHGTPEPSKIGKTESNGCVRLTNWDAQELAKLVEKGVTVEFVE